MVQYFGDVHKYDYWPHDRFDCALDNKDHGKIKHDLRFFLKTELVMKQETLNV